MMPKFGYVMRNGKIEINEKQAAILQAAAKAYINGTSLKTKAEDLTEQKVEYAPGKHTWNKNRVQRMLTDKRYLGSDKHEAILDRETFEQVQQIMSQRNTQKDCRREEIFSRTIVPIVCGKCGAITERKYDAHWKNSTHHYCTNPECKKSYPILDSDLWAMVKTELINADEITAKPSEMLLAEINRLNNEIDRELQYASIDSESVKKKIFEYAVLQYAALHTKKRESMDLTDIDPCSQIFIREVKRRVSAVILTEDNRIRLDMSGKE